MAIKEYEIWKDIKGYEGLYQISNYGRVKRLAFVNNVCSKPKDTIINPCVKDNKYLYVSLHVCIKNSRVNYDKCFAALVDAIAFRNEVMNGGSTV